MFHFVDIRPSVYCKVIKKTGAGKASLVPTERLGTKLVGRSELKMGLDSTCITTNAANPRCYTLLTEHCTSCYNFYVFSSACDMERGKVTLHGNISTPRSNNDNDS